MFLRRQDVLDQFDSNFRETEDGRIIFQPRRAKIGLPITAEEYEAITTAFERRQMIDMAITWVAILGGAGIGFSRLLTHDSFSAFFVGFGAGCVVAFLISLRGHLDVLLPLIQRLDELVKATEAEQRNADPLVDVKT